MSEPRKLLSEVFKILEENDLVARMDFLCCDTCAHLEIDKILHEIIGKKGYVFFHEQNTDRLLRGETKLYLAFGRDDSLDSTEIGEIIVSVFNEVGYTTTWDGDANTKVKVDINEEDILDMKPIWREAQFRGFSRL